MLLEENACNFLLQYSTYLYDTAMYIYTYHFHAGIFPVHWIIKVFTEVFQSFDSYFTIAMFEKVLEKKKKHALSLCNIKLVYKFVLLQ